MTTVFSKMSYEVIGRVATHMKCSDTYRSENTPKEKLRKIGYENIVNQVLNSRNQFSSASQAVLRFGSLWDSALRRFDTAFDLCIKTINEDERNSWTAEMIILEGEIRAAEHAFLWLDCWIEQNLELFGDEPEMVLPEEELYYARIASVEVMTLKAIANVRKDRRERMPEKCDDIAYWLM